VNLAKNYSVQILEIFEYKTSTFLHKILNIIYILQVCDFKEKVL